MKNEFFKTQDGRIVQVKEYDEANNIALIPHPDSPLVNHWVHEEEFSKWTKVNPYDGLPEGSIPPVEPIVDEVKQKTKKKKDAADKE